MNSRNICASQVNVNCSPEGNNWLNEKNAIVRIFVQYNGGTGHCSGALVNNTAKNGVPYVLTADHNISTNYFTFDAINSPTLTNWWFYFNDEWTGCTNSNPANVDYIKGAVVVANNSSSDFALLRLNCNSISYVI